MAMTIQNKSLLDRYPPGASSHRYRVTREEIERKMREGEIQRKRDEEAWRRAMEKHREASESESQQKPE